MDVAGSDLAFFVYNKGEFFRLVILAIELELYLFEVEDDVGHVLHYARKSGEFMLGARDFCCSDGSAFQRGKQYAPERIPYGVPITGLKRLGGEFGVSICGCALVFGESFRHLKTTVTDWHNFLLERRSRGIFE